MSVTIKFPLSIKTRKALEFSVKLIRLLTKSSVELKATRNILKAVFLSGNVPSGKREMVALHLVDKVGRRLSHDGNLKSFESDILSDDGMVITVSKDFESKQPGQKKTWLGHVTLSFEKRKRVKESL